MRTTVCFSLAALTILTVACTATPPAPPEPLATATAPVVHGQLHSGDDAVVFVWMEGAGSCTGTLVSPTVVLTAAHCVEGVDVGKVTVYFGDGTNGFFANVKEANHHIHPSADIAVIILAQEAPASITPIPIGTVNLNNHLGEPVRLVGFGVTHTDGSDSGVKRLGHTKLDSSVGGIMFMSSNPSNICFGDSGGPDFMTFFGIEFVVGVNSFVQGGCDAVSGSVRTDVYADWLSQYVDTTWDDVPPTVAFTTPAGTVTPGQDIEIDASDDHGVRQVSLFVGDLALNADIFPPFVIPLPSNLPAGEHTLEAIAVDVAGNETSATLAITIPMGCASDADCAADQACSDGVCAGAVGTSCRTPTDCASGVCFAPLGGEAPFCSLRCQSDAECPGDFACQAPPGSPAKKCLPAAGDGGTCAIAPGARSGRGLGGLAVLAGLCAVIAVLRRRRGQTA